jgi:glycerol-3-phosphate O-acyltransferase/dihydroxyacetone phosphate acyltransferase
MTGVTYDAAKLLGSIAIHTFFREIEVIGGENVPRTGPLIIYGNHNNQFADGLLMISKCSRRIRFLAAHKSMQRPLIGHFCKAFRSIPVKRAIDMLVPGQGKIIRLCNKTIRGSGTAFTRECEEGGMVRVAGN